MGQPTMKNTQPVKQTENEYRVEALLKARIVKRGQNKIHEYFAKLVGFPLHDATWEPQRNLKCNQLIKEFWAK